MTYRADPPIDIGPRETQRNRASPTEARPLREPGRPPTMSAPGLVRRFAGLVMIASFAFVIVGDETVIGDFFGTNDEALRLQYLLDAADDWDRAMTLYTIAGVLVAGGFALWAGAVHLARADRRWRRIASIGAIGAALGALAWGAVCYRRATWPPAEVAHNPDMLLPWALAWPLLSILATALIGWTLLRTHMRVRGWVIIVAAALLVPIGVILPLLVPLPVALTGVIITAARSSRPEPSVTSPEPLMP